MWMEVFLDQRQEVLAGLVNGQAGGGNTEV